jgi:selenocysteine-specific elongation factor
MTQPAFRLVVSAVGRGVQIASLGGAVALAEARELAPAAEAVAVSAKTGAGLDELRAALARVDVSERDAGRATRLYVDRVFTLPGIGTVATGTLWSGSLGAGDVLRLEPAGRDVRVRSVQVHDDAVERAGAGQRVAVNLAGVERRDLARGDVLVAPGSYPVSYRLDVRLEELEEIPAAVTVHVGTKAVPARVARHGSYAQLRLAEPVVTARGDRVVLRTETTVGGGLVLDPAPPRGLDQPRLEALEQADPATIVRALVHAPVPVSALQARGLLSPSELAQGLAAVRAAGEHVYSDEWLADLKQRVRARLAARAEADPLDPGLPLAELLPSEPWTQHVLNLLELDRRGAKAYLPGAAASLGARAQAASELEERLAQEEIVKLDDRALGAFLEEQGRLRTVGDGFAVSIATYERGFRLLRELPEITLAAFRDALGVGRRTAQLLLERYDADGITRRVGDRRVLRRARQ